MDARLAARPSRSTRLALRRAASREPSNEVVIAVATCGRNIAPYCVPLRS